MSIVLGGLFLLIVPVVLFITAYLIGFGHAEVAVQAEADRLLALMAQERAESVAKLAALRSFLETETAGLTDGQVYLLADVCSQLGYSDGEMQTVLGAAYLFLIDAPVDLGV